jgi:hypothetical protein
MELKARIKRLEKASRLARGSRLPEAPRVGGLPRHVAIERHIAWLRLVQADPQFFEVREQIRTRIAACVEARRMEIRWLVPGRNG